MNMRIISLPHSFGLSGSTAMRLMLAGLLLAIFSALAFSAQRWIDSGGETHASAVAVTEGLPDQQLERVHIAVGPEGFTPRSTTRAAGSFLLVINNQGEAGELSLRLTRDGGGGGPIIEYSVPAGSADHARQLDLRAGAYTLRDLNHPAWLFHITAQ